MFASHSAIGQTPLARLWNWLTHSCTDFEVESSHVIDDLSGDSYATVIRRCTACGTREVRSTKLLD